MKRGTTAEQSGDRRIDRPGGAVEAISQQRAHQANALAIDSLGKHRLRIEPGDKTFGADVVRHETGRDANRTVGTIDGA